tara:strand:+ start:28374 stop:28583 length:210 start_codon:yes stop_codon:yes gene_type:complete
METKKITTIKSVCSKILENKETGRWVEVRYTQQYSDGYIELWVYSGSNDDTLGFENLKDLKDKWLIVVD